MAIRVMLRDHTGNIRQPAKLDETASVERLIRGIVTALKLPITDPSGRPITYHLAYESRRLQEDETLESADVQENAIIDIVPEMIAGAMSGDTPLSFSQPLV